MMTRPLKRRTATLPTNLRTTLSFSLSRLRLRTHQVTTFERYVAVIVTAMISYADVHLTFSTLQSFSSGSVTSSVSFGARRWTI